VTWLGSESGPCPRGREGSARQISRNRDLVLVHEAGPVQDVRSQPAGANGRPNHSSAKMTGYHDHQLIRQDDLVASLALCGAANAAATASYPRRPGSDRLGPLVPRRRSRRPLSPFCSWPFPARSTTSPDLASSNAASIAPRLSAIRRGPGRFLAGGFCTGGDFPQNRSRSSPRGSSSVITTGAPSPGCGHTSAACERPAAAEAKTAMRPPPCADARRELLENLRSRTPASGLGLISEVLTAY